MALLPRFTLLAIRKISAYLLIVGIMMMITIIMVLLL